MKTPSRNEPCQCGSGKKYKQCCGQCDTTPVTSQPPSPAPLNITQAIQSALEYHQAGRLNQAISLYQRILLDAPNHPKVLHLLGVAAHQAGENNLAVEIINRAIQSTPANPVNFYNLGSVFNAINQPDEAIACYQKALTIKPDYVEALNNLGNTLKSQGKLKDAVACYKKIVSIQPGFANAHNNLGNALKDQGKLDEAITCYQQAVMIKPDFSEAHNNLGSILSDQGKLDEAIACYKQALMIKPDYAEAHNNWGNALKDHDRTDEAIACYQKALMIKPDYADAHNNLGNALKDQGKLDKAIACYQKALMIKPDYATAHHNKLLAAQYTDSFSPAELCAEHLKFAEQFEAPLKGYWRPHTNSFEPERRLKVGYVSPDFRNHAVAYFIEPIIANHDKSQVEVFCYYNHIQHDSFTDRIIAETDHWIPCQGMSDEELVERIRADKIDILVDLAGHTSNNRLLAFARKPAPVQVTYLGYVNTTGLSAMDYRLTHIDTDPHTNDIYYSEKLYRIPGNLWWCYRPRTGMPEVATPPVIANGFVTFGSTNNFAKLSPETIALWAELLHAIPTSRLLIAVMPEGTARESISEQFAIHGIDIHRLIIYGTLPSTQFWELHHQIDILLDPFPCNGGTTTCDALWLGVPLVTLTGPSFVSRMGYALLKNIGLPELAAENQQAYLSIAVKLASDLDRLKTLRAGMRARLSASPLRDEIGFTRNLEAAYRDMWQRWCNEQSLVQ